MLTPKNKYELAVKNVFMLLLGNRNKVLVSRQDLQKICRKAPNYALRLIAHNRTQLLMGQGSKSDETVHLIRTIEWNLRGASEFIKDHRLNTTDQKFILERLAENPDDFTDEDLNELVAANQRFTHPLRVAALDALSNRLASFAQRIDAEPPGLSEDIQSLKKSINDYGFTTDLNEILQKIDDELANKADAFDQTSIIRHIRSFFQDLHQYIAEELQRRKPHLANNTPLGKCGKAIEYLHQKQVLTEKFEVLGKTLYDILSDDEFGVHALKAKRDYTRLCRNMVVEYAVTLFFDFERRLAEPDDA